MIQEVGNIELFELLETDPKTQCEACLSYWSVGIVYCTFLATKKLRSIEVSLNIRWTFFTTRIRYQEGKTSRPQIWEKPGDKEYYLANQLKKKCKKKEFHLIHDRFLRDNAFRVRMIENNRDEEVCRRWDVRADEDHTNHLSEKEYFYYKNKWWLHLNKSGSDTLPLRKRSDFKQALSNLERLNQEAGEEPFVPTHSWKNNQWQSASSSSSTSWKWQDSWWSS